MPGAGIGQGKVTGQGEEGRKDGEHGSTRPGPQSTAARRAPLGRQAADWSAATVAAICARRSLRPLPSAGNAGAHGKARTHRTAGRSPRKSVSRTRNGLPDSPDGDSHRADSGSDGAHARDDEIGPITRDLAGLGLQLLALGLDAGYLGNQLLQLKSFAG